MSVHAARPLRRTDLLVLVAVALGGALGAVLRHGVDVAVPVAGRGFPWPTLLVNVTGSTALGALGTWACVQRRPALQGLLGPGLLGGFTTLSAYAEQGRRLLAADQPWLALGYLLGTLLGCLLGCLLGRLLGRLVGPLAATALLGGRGGASTADLPPGGADR